MTATSDFPSGTPGRALEEAAEWSVMLLDDPGDADLRRRFEAWRGRSPENEAAWEEIQHTTTLADQALPDYAGEWRPTPAVRRRKWLKATAALALLALLVWSAMPSVLLRLQADHMTTTAELRTIQLPDGSAVTMGPESSIAIAYTAGERKVALLQGEAFFDVRTDASRPFKVRAERAQATVLGTRFDVRLNDSDVMIAVEEGRVLVEGGRHQETLVAGQAVKVASAGSFQRERVEADSVAMWRQGLIYLKDQPVGSAVDEIRRYFSGRIVMTDGALAAQPTTGVFDLKDPEAALRGLAQAHGATVRRVTPWLLVVSGS